MNYWSSNNFYRLTKAFCAYSKPHSAADCRTYRFRPFSLVGWGFKGCALPADWKSVVSSPTGIRGEAPAANAFSAYSRPQNASRTKKKFIFQLSSAAWTTDPTIILSLRHCWKYIRPWPHRRLSWNDYTESIQGNQKSGKSKIHFNSPSPLLVIYKFPTAKWFCNLHIPIS